MCWGKVLLNVAVQYLDRKSNLHSENQLNTIWISVRFIYVRFIFHKHYSIVHFWYELWTMAFWKCYILLTKRNFTDWWKKIISYLNKNLILQKANIKTDDLKKWYTNLIDLSALFGSLQSVPTPSCVKGTVARSPKPNEGNQFNNTRNTCRFCMKLYKTWLKYIKIKLSKTNRFCRQLQTYTYFMYHSEFPDPGFLANKISVLISNILCVLWAWNLDYSDPLIKGSSVMTSFCDYSGSIRNWFWVYIINYPLISR